MSFRVSTDTETWDPMRRHTRVLAWVLTALITTVTLTACLNNEPAYELKGGEITPPTPAPELPLVDQYGQPFDVAAHQGKVMLLFFGYTHCPDVCPVTLSDFLTVESELGEKAENVEFVFVTVDPERDTPEVMAQYLSFYFDESFIGLTGTVDQIEKVKMDYGVFSAKVDSGSAAGYLVDHTSRTYVIDTNGDYRLSYAYGTDPEDIVSDIEFLLKED